MNYPNGLTTQVALYKVKLEIRYRKQKVSSENKVKQAKGENMIKNTKQKKIQLSDHWTTPEGHHARSHVARNQSHVPEIHSHVARNPKSSRPT